MESAGDTLWDVVISGTGLPQSLLALALSRSDKKVLHVDKNKFYGGSYAALTLQEADELVKSPTEKLQLPGLKDFAVTVKKDKDNEEDPHLSFSRAYSLSLNPQLIFTRSELLPTLVSSRVYRQLDFQALGHWYVLKQPKEPQNGLRRVPAGREDIFSDSSIDLKSKRGLMNFLQFVATYESHGDFWQPHAALPVTEFLKKEFGISEDLKDDVLAIVMSQEASATTSTAYAIPRIARHLRSIGMFGPGFGVVVPKWGGCSEIAQVSCRAGAVGGGVYMLGNGVDKIEENTDDPQHPIQAVLQSGEKVRSKCLIFDQSPVLSSSEDGPGQQVFRSISVVSSTLKGLFPVTTEGAPPYVGAVVVIPSAHLLDDSLHDSCGDLPVQLVVHSSDTGECPMGQCVIYASVLDNERTNRQVLDKAVRLLLDSTQDDKQSEVLYCFHYTQHSDLEASRTPKAPHVVSLPSSSLDLAFDDSMLDRVKDCWRKVLFEKDDADPDQDEAFMKFEDRENYSEEDFA